MSSLYEELILSLIEELITELAHSGATHRWSSHTISQPSQSRYSQCSLTESLLSELAHIGAPHIAKSQRMTTGELVREVDHRGAPT